MIIPKELYEQFCRTMPLACVDLVVVDRSGKVLLLLRKNDPAREQWWFPGGRVLHLEARRQAALRKLREECGIPAISAEELGTYDVILDHPEKDYQLHGVTTLFLVRVDGSAPIALDPQSATHKWRSPTEWRQVRLHEFVLTGLARAAERLG
jgi:colanic acid biosynthesis protein WcaH